jgi:hypothetical protein
MKNFLLHISYCIIYNWCHARNELSEEAENAINNGSTLLDETSGLDGENYSHFGHE